jgi:hypothetical protein
MTAGLPYDMAQPIFLGRRHLGLLASAANLAPTLDSAMIEKAKGCDNCLCWLKYCNAECCRGFQCPVGPNVRTTIKDGVLTVSVPMDPDRKWYYELHGVTVAGNFLSILKEHCEFLPGLVIAHMRCKLLTKDNLCAGHPDNKPEVCKGLTLETTRQALPMGSDAPEAGYRLTPNCLFNFKR